jgi:hypothetical protein
MHLSLYPYAFDDAYIHMRIAEYLSDFGEPYFNLGEPVKASSSSGWTIFLFLIDIVFRNSQVLQLPLLISLINTLMTFSGAILYTLLFYRLSENPPPYKYGLFIFILYISFTMHASIGLMEIPTTLVIVSIIFHLLLSRKRGSLIFIGLAIFFRLEMIIVLAITLFYVLYRNIFPWKTAIAFLLLGMIPFLIYDLVFFGTLIPNTVIAKSIGYEIPHIITATLIIESLLPKTVPGLSGIYNLILIGSCLFLFMFSGIILIRGMIIRWVNHKEHTSRNDINDLVIIFGVFIAVGYIIGHSFVFPWYVPLYAISFLFACFKVIETLQFRVIRLVFGLFLLIVLGNHTIGLFSDACSIFSNLGEYQQFQYGARSRQYIEIGRDLYQKYPEAILLTSEVGGLGYGFKGYILDGFGLISPEALEYHPMSVPDERSYGDIGAIPVGFIEKTNPDIVVGLDYFIEGFMKSNIKSRYEHYTYPVFLDEDIHYSGQDTILGSRYLNVFIRKDYSAKHTKAD